MTHYSPPAGAQMLPARAATSLCAPEGTKGSSLPSSSLSSLPSPHAAFFGSQQDPGVWHSLSPLPTHENHPVSSFLFAKPADTFSRLPAF
ncbi:unnamed protein product [Gulo gulo]|uniref:Uncharacterized protein n=1 Tax=Gulo gulo TaxID=48420 RepID=A0A9X9LNH2_GULGU|nr:unnamed protein product [Gulo gulo]